MTVSRTADHQYFRAQTLPGWHTLEEFLLQLRLGDLDLNSLVDLLGVSSLVVCIVLDGG